ncbi:metallophosphoesterase [Kutzneria buriramensis]|uniref:Calcineurin-like phosphoesterase family protein n=1 Tax=Kutzneria buriramensis TaxID=1045776 RepID=A0A3E0H269_9PSEU|nr:metallophosphoesterase [Kutzneria buriramensis]REH37134.1 calcineurin-like phosphoesterase family protein [Kutzneria buriramensis]
MTALFAQISDLHLDGTVRATDRARRVVGYLNGLARPVDAVLVTGDIADHGTEAEYEEAARLFATMSVPVLPCPGNHDVRGPYRKALLDEEPVGGPINRRHRVAGVTVLLVDGTVPAQGHGYVDDETIAWLEEQLRDPSPTLIALHHPPVRIHEPSLDKILLHSPDRLEALVAAHPQVIAVLTGHAHTAAASTFAGRPLVIAPAVTYALRMPWEGGDIRNWDQPPGVAFHVIDDSRIITHFRVA